MDWIDEKIVNIKEHIHNMSMKFALAAYILVSIAATLPLSIVTINICNEWIRLILVEGRNGSYVLLDGIKTWCPYVYAVLSMVLVSAVFYRRRLIHPIQILKEGIQEVGRENLNVEVRYDSEDEMGQVCRSFDEMRLELVKGKMEMWRIVDEQKKLNAAFAHDLRTPLTVLKGYSDFLKRYLPGGKVSPEKLADTLELMSGYIERLGQFTNTMKELRSMDERKIVLSAMSSLDVQAGMVHIAEMLREVGLVEIVFQKKIEEDCEIYVDRWLVMEVFENLMSNAMRYADSQILVSLSLEGNQMLYLCVEDDGRGFSQEELSRAAEPYYRKEREENTEHFGIGLHICTELCIKHEGTVSTANRMEKGAAVTASFCVAKDFLIKTKEILKEV